MITAQGIKIVRITAPAAILDNASATTNEVDTSGYNYCTIFVDVGATDIAATALKVQESDETGTGFADVTGLVYGTSTNTAGSTSTLPSATSDNTLFGFDIDLRARKRFLDLVLTGGDGTAGAYFTAYAVLSRGSETPTTATQRGFAQLLRA